MKEVLIDCIGNLCIENSIRIFDVPEFINNFQKHPVPFSFKNKKITFGRDFNYHLEHKLSKDSILEKLPKKMTSRLYEF